MARTGEVQQDREERPQTGIQAAEKLWTPANVVTLLRICGVPLFVAALISPWPNWFPTWSDAEYWREWVAVGIFIVLAATDGLDGYLARSRGEVTNFGKFMDPLADKILVAAALLVLIELGVLPSWVALVILCREFIVSGIRMVAASQGTVIAASWYGKFKTVFQIIALVLFIIKGNHMVSGFSAVLDDGLYLVSWAVMAVALVMTIVSMLDYFVKAKSLLGFSKGGYKGDCQGEQGREHDGDCQGEQGREHDGDCQGGRDEIESKGWGESRSDGWGEGCPIDLSDAAKGAMKASGIATEVLECARNKGLTLGTAESCTGGLVASALTAIPGSSDVFRGAIVSYANEVKQSCLQVEPSILAAHGAVSRQTALSMATGARNALNADIAVSLTGIAGPGGGMPGKPVGTVWIGVASAQNTDAFCHRFTGGRAAVRDQAVNEALLILKATLDGLGTSHPH